MFGFTVKRYFHSSRHFSTSRSVFNGSKTLADVLFNLPTYDVNVHRNKFGNKVNTDKDNSRKRTPRNHYKPKKLLIKWNSGTDKQQAAANSVLEEILKINPKGNIKAIDRDTNEVQLTNVRTFLKGMDLETNGITLVKIDEDEKTGEKVPMVKEIPSRMALKSYSNKLSEMKELELLKLGVNIKRVGRRANETKNEASWKTVKVSWQITDYDLNKQKYNEIVSQLQKGLKVALYINQKDSNNLAPIDAEELQTMDETKISKKDAKRREEVIEKLKEIVSEYSSQVSEEGSINKRMIMKVTPNLVDNKNNVDKRALKEQKKKERQEKLQKRLDRKKKTKESS